MRKQPVVAIDGPSGVGKSTVAKGVAEALGFQFIDTGALYRIVARMAGDAGIDWADGPAVAKVTEGRSFRFTPDGELLLDGQPVGDTIRTTEIALGASAVARHPEVRTALLHLQRQLGSDGGVVLEGRDIGTVVFPDAEAKFFLTASVIERARRRFLQLKEKGQDVRLEDITASQIERDRQDTERTHSPLRKADDAMEVDCEQIDARRVIEIICQRIRSRFP